MLKYCAAHRRHDGRFRIFTYCGRVLCSRHTTEAILRDQRRERAQAGVARKGPWPNEVKR